MDSRAIIGPSKGKPCVVRVKPALSQFQKHRAASADRAAFVRAQQERLRGLLEQASRPRRELTIGRSDDELSGNSDEADGSNLARLLSTLLGNAHSEQSLRAPLGRVLAEIDAILKEDVEQRLRIERERSAHREEELVLRFEQTITERESANMLEIVQLHGRIEYLQDELRTTRELNEDLAQRLEDANSTLLERAQDRGAMIAEIEDLREELKELRVFKAKHGREMQNIDRLRADAEKQKQITETVLEEFVKMENERDELRSEFEKSLLKLRQSNYQRNRAIVAELDEAEEELLG
ncbi:hypothetical protein Q1695_002463 [Nippostrongylus brasiliensis]|nr:hypothetical protein Q1695_002463 [Nippostrongylus brasiliensis]